MSETKESKIVATERLRKEGRWAEASLFKDEAIKRARDSGKTRSQAANDAWDEMLAKFPPLPPAPKAPDAMDLSNADEALIEQLAAVEFDWPRDVKWCYANLEHPRVRLESAPSLGAWALLRTARADTQKFILSTLQPVLKSHRAVSTPVELPSDDEGIAELQAMVDNLGDYSDDDEDYDY